MEHDLFTRRDFLRHLTLAGAATLLPLTARADAGAFAPVGKATAFGAGPWHAVTLPGGAAAYVKRLPGGTPKFLALSAACTHKGCAVAWRPADRRFHCPCHGGLFDAAGRNVAGPPPRPLARLPTQVRAGVLFVRA